VGPSIAHNVVAFEIKFDFLNEWLFIWSFYGTYFAIELPFLDIFHYLDQIAAFKFGNLECLCFMEKEGKIVAASGEFHGDFLCVLKEACLSCTELVVASLQKLEH